MRMGALAVHYGKEYLAWACRGLMGVCDEVHVFYAKKPSFGFSEGLVCPDTEDELVAEANRFGKVIWHRVSARNEGEHRGLMLAEAKKRGHQLVAIADADELWDPYVLDICLRAIWDINKAGRWLARFCHFWRSWQWTVVDGYRPIRIVDMRHSLDVDAYLDEHMQPTPIYHFGYAQTLATMQYKFSCHGHKAEYRAGWFEEKFLPWRPNAQTHDIHPCVNNLWPSAVPITSYDWEQTVRLAPEHPFRERELIE